MRVPPVPEMAIAILATLSLTNAGAAQRPDSALRRVVATLPAGTGVRVELGDAHRLTGSLSGAAAESFTIQTAAGVSLVVPHADVARFWRRDRAIGAGALVGAVTGAGAGAFFGLVVTGVCEYDCPRSTAGAAAVGALIVGAAGAAAGGIIGAAIPRWRQLWRGAAIDPRANERPLRESAAASSPPRRHTGEFTIQSVAGGFVPAATGALAGASAALAFRAGRVAFGPEVTALGGSQQVRSLAGTLRIDLGPGGTTRTPYLVAGAGGYATSRPSGATLLRGIAGAGVTLGARQVWRAEVRWHPVIQNYDGFRLALVTLGAGYRLAW